MLDLYKENQVTHTNTQQEQLNTRHDTIYTTNDHGLARYRRVRVCVIIGAVRYKVKKVGS